ncbi:MAG: hypothetical protein GVY13_08900 [Alphaproteobacteria bacterium]|jgi:hypothetical protein|nr:hypothetical protein [Alphaproteobacteria bacterium]
MPTRTNRAGIVFGALLAAGLFASGHVRAEIYCWGEDFGSNIPQPASGAMAELPADATDIELGVFVACGATPAGGGRCLDLTTGQELLSVPGGYRNLSAGSFGACVIDGEGGLRCAGDPPLSDGSPDMRAQYQDVSVGPAHACAVADDGSVMCWGADDVGQASPPSDIAASAVATGLFHSCALKTDGSVACWGDDRFGQASPPIGLNAAAVSAGGDHSCALTSRGNVVCWGNTDSIPAGLDTGMPTPVQIVSDGMQSCLRDRSGLVRCWVSEPEFVRIMPDPENLSTASDIDVGGRVYACAVTD